MKMQIKILNKKFYSGVTCFKGLLYDTEDNLMPHQLPSYATPGSAALDLVCTEDITIYPGEANKIHTGLAIWVGSDYKNQVRNFAGIDLGIVGLIMPRSGLGSKGLVLANTIGVIDEDYQGELIVNAWNRNPPVNEYVNDDDDENGDHEGYSFVIARNYRDYINIKAGDRFAQLVFVPVIKTEWEVVSEFSNTTERNQGGFGHTGD